MESPPVSCEKKLTSTRACSVPTWTHNGKKKNKTVKYLHEKAKYTLCTLYPCKKSTEGHSYI